MDDTSLDVRVVKAIYSVLGTLNLQRSKSQQLELSTTAALFGEGSKLDSLAFANFIVLMEQVVEKEFGVAVDLTQEDPFSPTTGYFRTVHSLAAHISLLLQSELGKNGAR